VGEHENQRVRQDLGLWAQQVGVEISKNFLTFDKKSAALET
jgi:hypothetical protein